MSDADDLARRFLALWGEYLTALVADPQAAELLQRWIAFTAQFARVPRESGSSQFPFWPPVPADVRQKADAAAAAGASGDSSDAVGELARRVAELERRLAELESKPKAPRPRRGNRKGRI